MPVLSFVVPHYETDPWVFGLCLESICEQRLDDFEVIVVDDGSSPECVRRAREAFEETGLAGKFVCMSHEGVSAARNRGAAEAMGEYITFVDSDDIVDRDFFAAVLESHEDMPDFVIGKALRIGSDEARCVLNAPDAPFRMSIVSAAELTGHFISVPSLARGFESHFVSGPFARIVKRSVVLARGFDTSLSFGEDTLWNLGVLAGLTEVGVVDAWAYGIRAHEVADSLSTKYRETILEEVTSYLSKVHDGFVTSDLEGRYSRLTVFWAHAVLRNQARLPMADAITPELREAFSREPFGDAISRSGRSGLPFRYALLAFLLRHRAYRLCLLYEKLARLRPGTPR